MKFRLCLLLTAVSVFASGCANKTVGNFCDLNKPHRFSDATISVMTDSEVEQELSYNELGRKLCGWQP